MYKKILEYITLEKLIKPNTTIIVGVSGGPDSVFLARTLHALSKPLSISAIILAHVNYGIRKDALKDQRIVESLAKELEHKLIITKLQTKNSSEEAMRESRMYFFNKIKTDSGAQTIALGHTRNDNIETFLLFLLRGAGLRGLSGIKQKAECIHPLLKTKKEDILLHLKKNNYPFAVDSTNIQNKYTRNKIRNIIIPLIKKEINPSISKTLSQTINSINNSHAALNFLVEKEIAQLNPQYRKHFSSFDKQAFKAYPRELQKEILIFLINKTQGHAKNITAGTINNGINTINTNKKNASIELKDGLQLTKTHDRISLHF